jgi:type II secretory pathway component PulK
MKRRGPKPGFALLMALALVLLAGAALAGVARWSATEALESTTAADELKQRWAVTSCRQALLGRAEELLDEAERGEGKDGLPSEVYLHKPAPEVRVTCNLAGLDYEIVLTDEQAKLNLNALLKVKMPAEVQSAATRLTRDKGNPAATAPVLLRAMAVPAWLPLGAYGQVFENPSPAWLIGPDVGDGLAATITCWGDGRVNLRRASEAVVQEACTEVLGPQVVSLLLSARQRNPYRSLSAILLELDKIDADDKAKVLSCVTDRSACHGLWIIARSESRSWYTLAVTADGAGAKPVASTYRFQW